MKNLLQNTRSSPAALIAMGALVVGIAGSFLLHSSPASAMSHTEKHEKAAFTAPDPNYPEIDIPPVFNAKNQLIQPKFFREKWVHLGSPTTPNALNNGKAGFPEFHNVYVQPAAFDAYRKTGKWPVGTMLLKELQLIDDPKGEYPDSSRIMPSGRGFFPGPVNGMDIMVKDPKRFPESKNWGFFNFNHAPPPYKAASTEASIGECAGCHIANAQEDMVYIKTYLPVLTPLPLPDTSGKKKVFSTLVDSKGTLTFPTNFPDGFVHIGSIAIAADGGVSDTHSTYARPADIAYFRTYGHFPDGAELIKEVSATIGSAHTTGLAYWASETKTWFMLVKDSTNRFPGHPQWGNGWGWAQFNPKDTSQQLVKDYKTDCLHCHVPVESSDWIYTYAYPALGEKGRAYTPAAAHAVGNPGQGHRNEKVAENASKMANSNVGKGKVAFDHTCSACHSTKAGENRTGPSLFGVMGRKAGTAPGYSYSDAMLKSSVIWSRATVDKHLADTKNFIPGNHMGRFFPGVPDADGRANITSYLETVK